MAIIIKQMTINAGEYEGKKFSLLVGVSTGIATGEIIYRGFSIS